MLTYISRRLPFFTSMLIGLSILIFTNSVAPRDYLSIILNLLAAATLLNRFSASASQQVVFSVFQPVRSSA